MIKKNKKASYVFNMVMAISSIIILTTSLITVWNNPGSTLRRSIGTKQYDVLSTTISAEKNIFYLNQLTKYIIQDLIEDLSSDGGFVDTSPCGKISGSNKYYNLWNTNTLTCFPNYLNHLSELYHDELSSFTPFDLPQNNFTLSLVNQGQTLLFLAKGPSNLKIKEDFYYSYYSSFKVNLENPLEIYFTIEDSKELIESCNNQPLECLVTFTQFNNWIIDNDELSYEGQLTQNIADPTTLMYHTFSVTNSQNSEYSLDFALFINSDISDSGESEQLTTSEGSSHTFEDSNEDEHILTIDSIGTDQISGTITSDPIPFTLSKYQEIVVDITGDGTFDLYLRLDSIEGDQAELTITLFDKPEEIEQVGTPELPLIPLETGTSICAKSGGYGNDFDANVLIEWAQETGYNPCYVAAFINAECGWRINQPCNSQGYCGAFQWGEGSLTDMKSGSWGTFPLVNVLDSHEEIVNMNLEQQLNLLTEFLDFRAQQSNGGRKLETLDDMYLSVAFPNYCLSLDKTGDAYNNNNLSNIVRNTSRYNSPWHYPGENYATCKGIVAYAYRVAKADPSLSFCSCLCEDENQKMCPVLGYQGLSWGTQGTTELYNWPVQDFYEVNSCYGYRPYLGVQGDDGFHDGIDIPTSLNTPVKPMAEGTVYRICREGYCSGFGNNIVIQHLDNFFTGYNHLNTVPSEIFLGDSVTTETIIGFSGNTGFGGAIHLDVKAYTSASEVLGGNKGKNPLCHFPSNIIQNLNFTGHNCGGVYEGYNYPGPITVCGCSDVGPLCPYIS